MPKLLWITMNSLLDTSSGASMSIRELLKNLASVGWDIKTLTATCFDVPTGQSMLDEYHDISQIEDHSYFKVTDSNIEHKIFKTPTSDRAKITTGTEALFWRLTQVELESFEPDVVFSYGARPLDLLTQYEARYRGILTGTYLVNGTYASNRWCLDSNFIFTDTQATANHYKKKLLLSPICIGKFINKKSVISETNSRESILMVNPAVEKGGFILAQIVDWFSKYRPDIPFDVVEGRSGWDEIDTAYRSHISKEKPFDNVNAMPHQKNIKTAFKRARITLVPSLWYESGARIIAESLLNKVPCVVTDIGGNSEMVGNAGTVIALPDEYHIPPYTKLLNVNAVEKICQEILRYFSEPYYQEKIKICEVEAKRFNAEANAKILSGILTDALSKSQIVSWKERYKNRHLSSAPPIVVPHHEQNLINDEMGAPENIIRKSSEKAIYSDAEGRVVKKFSPTLAKNYFREKEMLTELRNLAFIPKLVEADDKDMRLVMEHGGISFNSENFPPDWESQIKAILIGLRSAGVCHNDLKPEEILVGSDGKLRIVDFEFSSRLGDDVSNVNGKARIFDDRDIQTRLSICVNGFPSGSEVHCFILWDTNDDEAVRKQIASNFNIIYQITYTKSAIRALGGRDIILDGIYFDGKHSYGEKGLKAFTLFVVIDDQPIYAKVFDKNYGGGLLVNKNTHALKQSIRNGRQGYLHASNNLLESFDALNSLTMYKDKIPSSVFNDWRPQFDSLVALFTRLDDANINYCVLRNHEMLPDQFKIDEHGDIDILVENYSMAKSILGGLPFKHRLPRTDPRWGPPVENGGYKVANKVSVAGLEVEFDIRFVGDGYYDAEWQANMLKNRKQEKCFYRLNEKDYFYSLLYHALIHKVHISDTYWKQFVNLGSQIGIELNILEKLDEAALWSLLREFLDENAYKIVRPIEKNIPFNVRNLQLSDK